MDINNNVVRYFTGVVEDRHDPLKEGRVRVRIYGEHPYQKTQGSISGVGTEDLIWMNVLQPTTSASISGVGHSNTGIVEGTSVYGHWLDKYKMSGLIIGTYGSNRKTMPNYTEGFSDPNQAFPRYTGLDTNSLAQGGSVGSGAYANVRQGYNLVVGINPSDAALADIPEDDNPDYTISQMLRNDEGYSETVYHYAGLPHIGIGHLITSDASASMDKLNNIVSGLVGRKVTGNPGRITQQEVDIIFRQDLEKVYHGISSNNTVYDVYKDLNASRKMAIENMCFQMGVGGVAKFTTSLDYMKKKQWKAAYTNLQQSLWFHQTPQRATAVAQVILLGNMEPYGVMPKTEAKKSLSAAVTVFKADDNNDDPSQPFTPTDTRIMFKEPEPSYAGQYPYVHTYESESGHIQEFDDTPNHARYRLVHPTGAYMEVQPTGDRIIKSFDQYNLTNNNNTSVSGNNLYNVKGNEVHYTMGSYRCQVDGDTTIYLRGNETKTVEGSGTLLVDGNVTVVIKGQAQVHVEQEAQIIVDKDASVVCNQNADVTVAQKATIQAQNLDVDVEQTLNLTATDINLNASGSTKIDSAGLTKVTGGQVQVG